jgi:GxxExxY protein
VTATDLHEPSASVDTLARAVIGAAIEVHRVLGPGFLEEVYEEALCRELKLRGIPFDRQKPVRVEYKGDFVGEGRLDLLVGDLLIVELKAAGAFAPIDRAKVISYLRAARRDLALLINFHVRVLKDGVQRVVQTGAW